MLKDWNIEEITGYKPISTLYTDFSIADAFGEEAVKDTYNRVMEHWAQDYRYLTEFVMVLNWKIWEHYEKKPKLAKLYEKLWTKTENYAYKNLKGEQLSYFIRTID